MKASPGPNLLSQPDMMRIHRRVVLVGAAAAWFAATIFLLAGFVSGHSSLYLQAVGPILAAGLMTALIVLHRENGGVALFGSAVVVMVMYTVIDNESMLLPAALSLVVICSLGMLFVARRVSLVAIPTALALAIAPRFWGLSFPETVQLGSLMMLGFAMTTVIFITIRNAAATLNTKFVTMFESSPSALLEEDWSGTIEYISYEHAGRPVSFSEYLTANPDVVRAAVGKARVLRANQAAADLFEASETDELLGSRSESSVTGANIDAFIDVLAARCEGNDVSEAVFATRTFRGQSIRVHARCVGNPSSRVRDNILIALADVTSLHAKEEAMAELIRAKDEFIASVSHELRTPLTAVVGLTSEMSNLEMSAEEMTELMALVSDQAMEMSHIIEDLLVAARADLGTVRLDLEEVDLSDELGRVIDGLGLDPVVVTGSIPPVIADAARVRQVLRNLLTNVDRYGGPRYRALGGRTEDMSWMELRDNGEGVAMEDVERIFEPYGTAHAGVAGSVGLGLAVARQLAEIMGGSLVYLRDGDESVFRLELPLTRAAVPV